MVCLSSSQRHQIHQQRPPEKGSESGSWWSSFAPLHRQTHYYHRDAIAQIEVTSPEVRGVKKGVTCRTQLRHKGIEKAAGKGSLNAPVT
jgi:hypothetical protein